MKKTLFKKFAFLLLGCSLLLVLAIPAYASEVEPEADSTFDTSTASESQTELQAEISQPGIVPDVLVLQLGPEWAGVEFQMMTDLGLYPEPIVVDEMGILRLEMSGSKNYTLSCLDSGVVPPVPGHTELDENEAPPDDASVAPEPEPISQSESSLAPTNEPGTLWGIPIMHLVLFGGGLLVCVGILIALKVVKSRRSYGGYDPDDEEE